MPPRSRAVRKPSPSKSLWFGHKHCCEHSGTGRQVEYPPQVGLVPAQVGWGAQVTVPGQVVQPGQVTIFQQVGSYMHVGAVPHVFAPEQDGSLQVAVPGQLIIPAQV